MSIVSDAVESVVHWFVVVFEQKQAVKNDVYRWTTRRVKCEQTEDDHGSCGSMLCAL